MAVRHRLTMVNAGRGGKSPQVPWRGGRSAGPHTTVGQLPGRGFRWLHRGGRRRFRRPEVAMCGLRSRRVQPRSRAQFWRAARTVVPWSDCRSRGARRYGRSAVSGPVRDRGSRGWGSRAGVRSRRVSRRCRCGLSSRRRRPAGSVPAAPRAAPHAEQPEPSVGPAAPGSLSVADFGDEPSCLW